MIRTGSITWVAKGELDDVIQFDQVRVDAFVNQVTVDAKIVELETRIAELEAVIAKR